jgi:hypothetical protein
VTLAETAKRRELCSARALHSRRFDQPARKTRGARRSVLGFQRAAGEYALQLGREAVAFAGGQVCEKVFLDSGAVHRVGALEAGAACAREADGGRAFVGGVD